MNEFNQEVYGIPPPNDDLLSNRTALVATKKKAKEKGKKKLTRKESAHVQESQSFSKTMMQANLVDLLLKE